MQVADLLARDFEVYATQAGVQRVDIGPGDEIIRHPLQETVGKPREAQPPEDTLEADIDGDETQPVFDLRQQDVVHPDDLEPVDVHDLLVQDRLDHEHFVGQLPGRDVLSGDLQLYIPVNRAYRRHRDDHAFAQDVGGVYQAADFQQRLARHNGKVLQLPDRPAFGIDDTAALVAAEVGYAPGAGAFAALRGALYGPVVNVVVI